MANKWVEHVRKWSAEHGVSYMCATGMPACKEAYNKGKAPKNTQKANREQMGNEDVRSAKKEAELLKESKESASMGMEDRDVGPKRRIKPRGPPAGPPPLTAEQVAEVKKANKASQMARLRAQRKEQGLSNTGKTFVRPKDSPSPRELEQMGVEDIKSALLRRAQGIVQPVQSADTAVGKPKGRPKKYATAEEAKRMKSVKTVEARRAKKAKAKEGSGLSGGVITTGQISPAFNAHVGFKSLSEPLQQKVLRTAVNMINNSYDGNFTNASLEDMQGINGFIDAVVSTIAIDAGVGVPVVNTDVFGKGYHNLQEVTDDELFRTMVQGGARPSGHAGEMMDNYSMIINHLVEHISDPSEPVDPRDYDQAIHFIREMRRAKGGAELYSREYAPRYGGAYTPVNSGNQFLDVIAHTGHQLGQDHPASKFGLNPFDMGEKLGEKLGNAMMKTNLGNPHTGIFSKHFWTPKKHRR